jgi:NAD-dependent deacetylase
MTTPLEHAASLLSDARRVVAFTGAGMSKESGVPTFRDAQTGLWAQYDPMQLATPEAFRQNPARVFGWYLWRLRLVRAVSPHAGHLALPRLAQRFQDLTVVTQNVDGLHRRAGSERIVELHGAIEAFRCFDAGHPFDPAGVDALLAQPEGDTPPPACPDCGSPVRPGVVWFGEGLPQDAVQAAWEAVDQCDVLLAIGTSAVVFPAAELPHVALRAGASVIEVNPDPTPLTPYATVAWHAAAGEALPELLRSLEEME